MLDPSLHEALRASHYELDTETRLATAGLKDNPNTAEITQRYAWLYALDNLEDVARIILELMREDGLPLPDGLEPFEAGTIIKAQLVVTAAE